MDKYKLTLPMKRNPQLEAIIRQNATEYIYPAKKVFLEPGDTLGGVYYIAEGRTRHYMVEDDGAEKILYILSSGWFYGEAPNLVEEPTVLYSRTDMKSKIWKIPTARYLELMESNKIFREAILENNAQKMLIMCHEIKALSFHSLKDRLKQFLISTADTTQVFDGGARGTVNKLINELYDENFIRKLNKNMQINAEAYRVSKGGID